MKKIIAVGRWRLEIRPDRLHMSRPDPTQDAGPCDCSIGADHDGPPTFAGGVS